MRGKPEEVGNALHHERIIPAHAGQTAQRYAGNTTTPDHPRACGANCACARHSGHAAGSSPRMRGKRRPQSNPAEFVRIIPAHAGQTVMKCIDGDVHADHPRACGANQGGLSPNASRLGSSPRMRGKQGAQPVGHVGVRIIPAHAGQTEWYRRSPQPQTDHPRACGANGVAVADSEFVGGSSPRMRGKPSKTMADKQHERIIPAHAGQTADNHQCP